jgi:two-component system response regulator (stage 0 sporulation protein F)
MKSLDDKRILVVDDDEILREIYMEEFQLIGAKVKVAASGNKAIKILEESSDFDLVITDVQMPDGDGTTVLSHLKSKKGAPQTAVIMISGYTDLPKDELLKKGAHAVLSKPFELDEIIDLAISLCESKTANLAKAD